MGMRTHAGGDVPNTRGVGIVLHTSTNASGHFNHAIEHQCLETVVFWGKMGNLPALQVGCCSFLEPKLLKYSAVQRKRHSSVGKSINVMSAAQGQSLDRFDSYRCYRSCNQALSHNR